MAIGNTSLMLFVNKHKHNSITKHLEYIVPPSHTTTPPPTIPTLDPPLLPAFHPVDLMYHYQTGLTLDLTLALVLAPSPPAPSPHAP